MRRKSRRCSQTKCVVCHTEGGMGPFAMDSYDVVKAMAPMIREALRTKRMPPYHSDNHGSNWTDDMRPTNAQVKTVDQLGRSRRAARRRASIRCRKRPSPPRNGRWASPIIVLQMPAFEVPASGIIDYQDASVATGAHRRQMAEGDGLGQRYAGRAPRARRLDSEGRSERQGLLVEHGARRLRPRRRAEPDARRHRHLHAAGRLVRLPDALHRQSASR